MLAKRYPDFTIKEAEREKKHGHTYMDIEGVLGNGEEIEFDMLLDHGQWRVVEIQRDLALESTPKIVKDALFADDSSFSVDRIIESDQGDGVVVYEFYSAQKSGKTLKKEVKLENETATLLKEEWAH